MKKLFVILFIILMALPIVSAAYINETIVLDNEGTAYISGKTDLNILSILEPKDEIMEQRLKRARDQQDRVARLVAQYKTNKMTKLATDVLPPIDNKLPEEYYETNKEGGRKNKRKNKKRRTNGQT